MTEAFGDILAWVAVGVIAVAVIGLLILGFRLPKKGAGGGE